MGQNYCHDENQHHDTKGIPYTSDMALGTSLNATPIVPLPKRAYCQSFPMTSN